MPATMKLAGINMAEMSLPAMPAPADVIAATGLAPPFAGMPANLLRIPVTLVAGTGFFTATLAAGTAPGFTTIIPDRAQLLLDNVLQAFALGTTREVFLYSGPKGTFGFLLLTILPCL